MASISSTDQNSGTNGSATSSDAPNSSSGSSERSKIKFSNQDWIDSVQPKPHRCHQHLDDLLLALQTLPLEVSGPFSAFWACLKSTPGQEPERYQRQAPVEFTPQPPPKDSVAYPFLKDFLSRTNDK
ncbi:hypothetical protein BKA69DRAFT_1120889 [Paraphysoderma sedebokerense]|nr:hypothetical protein BKA69DRAFT_1120889 [Paraphysoderma sedebokerense]